MTRLIIATLVAIALPTARAHVTGPVPLTSTTQTISAGPGAQTDAHGSGSRVSYTNRTASGSEVRVFDFETGEDTPLQNTLEDVVFQDSISNISEDYVVFTRRETTNSTQEIAFVDLSDPTLSVRIIAPNPAARRTSAAVGSDTVAFQQFTTASSSLSAVCVASLSRPSDPALCLTAEDFNHGNPAVSPDGNTVVFQECTSANIACDIYAARRTDGAWGAPVAITSGGGNDLVPDTNGSIVVYSSDAAAPGDYDVYYEPVTGTGAATRLELTDAPGSAEQNPNISGTLITMERTLPGETNADLYLFDVATNTFSRLTDTPDIDEHLSDVSLRSDGTVHVVWAAVDPLNPNDADNVYGLTFSLNGPSYLVCPLFDTSRSFKAGRVAPLRIQLCAANGANLSSPDLVLTATGLVQLDSTASTVLAPESPGEANADGVFRYDGTLAGYVFNLSTHGLSTGSWELRFRVSGDPAVYGIRFDVK